MATTDGWCTLITVLSLLSGGTYITVPPISFTIQHPVNWTASVDKHSLITEKTPC